VDSEHQSENPQDENPQSESQQGDDGIEKLLSELETDTEDILFGIVHRAVSDPEAFNFEVLKHTLNDYGRGHMLDDVEAIHKAEVSGEGLEVSELDVERILADEDLNLEDLE
jgi:hypothetical protein